MAFRRKKIKDGDGKLIKEPVSCSVCKEKKAFHTMHGGALTYRGYGGNTCCNDCVDDMRGLNRILEDRESKDRMTEADYQTWGKL